MKEAFVTALKENTVGDFLKANDCEGTVEDVMKFIDSKREGELCDDDMEKVAGGICSSHSCNLKCDRTFFNYKTKKHMNRYGF